MRWNFLARIAEYTIVHADGESSIPVNQTGNGGRWNSLGTYRFDPKSARVKLASGTTGDGYLIADAVRWVALDPPPAAFELTTKRIGDGNIEIAPEQSVYEENTEIRLTAIPEDGYEFLHWSGGFEGTENPLRISIGEDLTITAHFAQTYGAWENRYFTEEERTIPGFTDPENDSFSTGIPNLLNYAFGLIPRNPDFLDLPSFDSAAGQHSFRYRRLTQTEDLEYKIERSDNLVDWFEWIPENPHITVSGAVDFGVEEVKVGLAVDTIQQLFIRLRVERVN